MSRDTEILVGVSGAGKTAELIKRSAESGIYILVANPKRAEIIAKQARDMGLYIPFPVTLKEWLRSDTKFHGSSIRRDGLLIDDIDDVIKELFSPIEIKAVTLRTPNVITNLDTPTADVVEDRHGEWVVDAYKGDEIVRIPYVVHEHDEPYCSLCGTYALLDGKEDYVPSNFCPRCGAKMDGERRKG